MLPDARPNPDAQLLRSLFDAVRQFRNEPALEKLAGLRGTAGFCAMVDAWDDVQDHYGAALAAQPAPAPAIPQVDAITVNLVRLAGLDKHKARECEAIVRQVLAAAAPPPQGEDAERPTLADARRYRGFFDAGLPITFMGVEYHDKASLDAAIDHARNGAQDEGRPG